MAIDLASSSSPFEFQNMLPLDVLAAVASEKLKDEIHSPYNQRIKTPSSVKRNIKKSPTSVLTFEDVRCMPAKLLIDKFSETTSDELTKKYSYKCMLLPQKCSSTFRSFGNEKKACDEMKSHLLLHMQQLAEEYESNHCDIIFTPISPNSRSKYAEKFSKKIMKKQQTSLNDMLPRKISSKVSRKSKNSAFPMKTLKKNIIENRKCVPRLKNGCNKIQEKKSSVYLPDNFSSKQFCDDSFIASDEKFFFDERDREMSDQDCDSEHYSSYSQHLKNTFFTDIEVKEEIGESLSDFGQILHSNDSNSSNEGMNCSSSQAANANFDQSFVLLQDHNYTCVKNKGAESNKVLPLEFENILEKYEDPFLYLTREFPPHVIKTPPFPYVHIPLLPEVAEVIELRLPDSNSAINEYIHYTSYLYDANAPKSDAEEALSDEYSSDHEDKYSDDIFYKMNGPNGSVLECVENIENKKYTNLCVPKNEIPANENDENLENLQKDEKELALKYIAKLHSKGKKKISDSLICQICPDKHFTAQATLLHHYRSHAGIKPYICKLCSAKFTRQHSLNYHMLIHQNLSRFTCDACGRTFRHPSHYKEHLRRHTGETPYHCTDCNLHFKTRNTFKRHLKTRHGKLLTAGGIEDMNVE